MAWTNADERECFTNGWAIFDYDGRGIDVIMKIDDIHGYRYDNAVLKGVKNRRHFRLDDAATAWVRLRAEQGCKTSRKALKMCPQQDAYLAGDI